MTAHRHPFTRRALRRSPVLLAALVALGAQAATFTVTNGNDIGTGSLRQAIADAAAGDTVNFAAGVTTVTLDGTELGIGTPLTIQGPGVTITANYKSRVLTVATGTTVRLEGLTITGGALAESGGVAGQGGGFVSGAGIFNAGQLTLKDVTVTANAAGGGGASAGLEHGGGGGFAGLNQADSFAAGTGAAGTVCSGGNAGTTGTAGGCGSGGGGGGTPTGGGAGGANSTGANGGGGGGYDGGGGGGGFFEQLGGNGGGSSTTANGASGTSAAQHTSGGGGGWAGSAAFAHAASGGGGAAANVASRPGSDANGGIYNKNGATLVMTGNTRVTNNVAAGGGGSGRAPADGGNNNGGRGVGGLWNDGALYQGANVVFSGNQAASGGAGGGGTVPEAVNDTFLASPLSGPLLEVAVTGGGSVSADTVATPSMGGIDGCASTGGEACVAGYPAAQVAPQVTLTATAAAGQPFTGWGGACSGSALTCTVTMDQARSVTAAFAAAPVAVPTLGQWGLLLLGLLAAGLGGRGLRERRSL